VNHPIQRHINRLLTEHDLPTGTALENRVTWRLHRWGYLDGCKLQHRVGKYRLDYAWPNINVALEADGPMHWNPNNAAHDVCRDSYLRGEGWVVFRVDDLSSNLDEQVMRVVRYVGHEQDMCRRC
jgi:very-short-patch-repair endonuclease